MISQNCHWQKKSTLCTSYSLCRCNSDDGSLVLLATPKSNLERAHWEECAGISLQALTGGNGYPSIYKFPGNLPPSSPPQICLASGFAPQLHQRCTQAGWWHCFSGLGSPCPRRFITLALKTNPACTSRYQRSCSTAVLCLQPHMKQQHMSRVRSAGVQWDVGHG